jgi:hypothetical protein
MTYPQPGPYPGGVPIPPPSRPPRRWPMLLAGILVGAVVGAASIVAAWALSGSSTGEGAVTDAEAACAAIGRTGRVDPTARDGGYERWGAAAAMARAAAVAEPQYEPLAEALRRPIDIVARTFEASGPEFDQAMAQARQACADL